MALTEHTVDAKRKKKKRNEESTESEREREKREMDDNPTTRVYTRYIHT